VGVYAEVEGMKRDLRLEVRDQRQRISHRINIPTSYLRSETSEGELVSELGSPISGLSHIRVIIISIL
jgi:hypothetical protein